MSSTSTIISLPEAGTEFTRHQNIHCVTALKKRPDTMEKSITPEMTDC